MSFELKGEIKMSFGRILIRMALIFSETCFFIMLNFGLAGSFQGSCPANPAVFLVLTGVLTVANSIISGHNMRRLTIGCINLLLIGLMVAGMTWRSGPVFFVIPEETLPAINMVLFDLLFMWLCFRSVYLSYKKRLPDLYGHFDLFMVLTFLVLLVIGLAKISLPGEMIWVIAAVFFNLLPLFIINHTGSEVNPLSLGILVLFTMFLLFGAAQTVSLFPYVSGTAGNIFDGLKSIFLAVISFLGNILVFLIRLIWNRKIAQSAGDNSAPVGQELQTGVSPATPSWVNMILQMGFLVITVVLLITAATIFCQLLRYLIVYLLKREDGPKTPQISFNPFKFWKEAYVFIIKFLKKSGYLLLLFWPAAGLPVDRAYRQLLWWGSWKRHPRKIHETPHVYGKRLTGYYPELSAELREITDAYVIYRYSGGQKANMLPAALKPLLRKLYLFDWYRLVNFCWKRLNLKADVKGR
jgi:hypothetical protein